MVNKSIVYTSMINRYFDPTVYKANGFMPFIAVTCDEFDLVYKLTVRQELYITLNDISYYNFPYVDTSQLAYPDMSQKFKDYKTLKQSSSTFLDSSNTKLFYLRIMQAREYTEIVLSIQSLDLVLGLVGGLVGIIWTALALLVGPYEEFKFQTSLVGSIYPVSPQKDKDEPPVANRDEAKEVLEGTIVDSDKFSYDFTDYIFTWILRTCCCCCVKKNSFWWKKQEFKYQRYEDATERLNKEIDIVKHVSNLRISGFLAKLILRKHQRALVRSFRDYQLDDMLAEEEAEKRQSQKAVKVGNALLYSMQINMEEPLTDGRLADLDDERLTEDQIMLLKSIREKFNPDEVVADVCMLYEISGFQDETTEPDFWDEYMDFFELGNDENMIAFDKLKKGDLTNEQINKRQDARKNRREGVIASPSALLAQNDLVGAR